MAHFDVVFILERLIQAQGRFSMKRLIATLCILLLFPLIALAEIPDQLKKDFSPITGAIIMPIGDEYLINLDGSVNLHVGDILTLVMAGEKVIDPQTKQVIGTIDLPKGYLQVTRIKSGYSYAKLLTPGLHPQKGDKVQRFDQVPTRFEATQKTGLLAKDLKTALPNLKWVNDADKTDALLFFVLDDKTLKVTNAAGEEIKSYPYQNGNLSAPPMGAYQEDIFRPGEAPPQKKTLLNQTISSLTTNMGFGKDKRLENPAIIQGEKRADGIWIGPNMDGNPAGIAIADFDGDGQDEIAVAMEDHLKVFRLTDDKLKLLEKVYFAPGIHLLSLDTVDLDNNGQPELYLSANSGAKLSSQVVEFVAGHYTVTRNAIPWFMRVIEFPQEGRVLVAQPLGEVETPLAATPFRVALKKGKLVRGGDLALPRNANILSFLPFRGNDNDLLYSFITARDYLYVTTPSGMKLWQSGDEYGGSEVFLKNDVDPSRELIQPIYIQQRLLLLPTGEVLAARNKGPRWLEGYKNFKSSHVVALKWNGFAMEESWQTSDQDGYLADFAVADTDNDGENELVMAIKFKNKNLLQKGRSAIVIYELSKKE